MTHTQKKTNKEAKETKIRRGSKMFVPKMFKQVNKIIKRFDVCLLQLIIFTT